MDNVGNAIKEYLKQNGITQTMVANKLGKSHAQINMYLSGKKKFGTNMAREFADAYGFSIAFLLTGEGTLFGDEISQKTMQAIENDEQQETDPESMDYWKGKCKALESENEKLHELLKTFINANTSTGDIQKSNVG